MSTMVHFYGKLRAAKHNEDAEHGIRTRELHLRESSMGDSRLLSGFAVGIPDFILAFGPVEDQNMRLSDASEIRDIAEELVQKRLRRVNWGKDVELGFAMLGGARNFWIIDKEGFVFVGGGMAAFEAESVEDVPSEDRIESIVEEELSTSLVQALQDTDQFSSITGTRFTPLSSPPTIAPTANPTSPSTVSPTMEPTTPPTPPPSSPPSSPPTIAPTTLPTTPPTPTPTPPPSMPPTGAPSAGPTVPPTAPPTMVPSAPPSTTPPVATPTVSPTSPQPTTMTELPDETATLIPTTSPSGFPSQFPASDFAEANREVDSSRSGGSSVEIPAVAGSAAGAFAVAALVAIILVVRRRRRKNWRQGADHNSPTDENESPAYIRKGGVPVDASSDAGSSRLGRIISALDAVVHTRGVASDMDHSNTSSDDDTDEFTEPFENVEEVEPKIVPFVDPEEAPSHFNNVKVIQPNMVPMGEVEDFPPDFENVEVVAPIIVPIGDAQSFERHASLEDFDGWSDASSSKGEYVKAGEFLLNDSSWDPDDCEGNARNFLQAS